MVFQLKRLLFGKFMYHGKSSFQSILITNDRKLYGCKIMSVDLPTVR